MNPARDPVWRGSLVVLLRHYPAYAVAVLLGCAALAVATLSGRSFVDAAEVALLQGQAAAAPAGSGADEQAFVRASLFDPASPRVEQLVDEKMGRLDGGSVPLVVRRPILYRDSELLRTPTVVGPSGTSAVGVLFDATGAVSSLVPADGSPDPGDAGAGGVWVPDVMADELGVGPGDPLGLALVPPGESPPTTPTTVAGVYRTAASGVPEDPTGLWRRLGPDLPPWPSHLEPTTAQLPLLVADTDTYTSLSDAIGEQSLDTWDVVPDADPVRIDDAQRLVDAVTDLQEEAADPRSLLFKQLSAGRDDLRIATGLTEMIREARVGYSATIQGVSAVRIVGMGLSWLVVALAGIALLVRRRGERQLHVDSGRSSLELAALTLAEVVVPVALGLTAGAYAARPLVAAIVGVDGTPVRPQDTLAVALLAVATLVLTSYGDAVRRHRRSSVRGRATGRGPGRVPWRTVVVTLAVVGAVSAYTGGDDFDTTTALFPLTAVTAVGVLASAVLAGALDRVARRWQPRRLGARMTFARLARDRASSTSFLAATVAFGAVAYGLLFQVSADRAADDKVATQVGAESVFQVSRAATDPETLVDDDSTLVRTAGTTVEGGTARQRLYAVDPDTFARAAQWSPRFAGGRSLDDVLAELGGRDDVLEVAVAGDGSDVPTEGGLVVDGRRGIAYRVVERLSSFPGIGQSDTLLVADARAVAASRVPADGLTTYLWTGRDADDVERGTSLKLEDTAAQLRADPALVARAWVTDYLQAFTLLALGLGLLVLVGLHRRDREQRRLLDVTLADLGRPARLATRAAGRELGVVAVLGAVAGGVAAYVVTWSLRGPLDPLPDVAPALAVTGTDQLLLAAVAFVAATVGVTLLAGRLGRARSVNELLHDE